MQRWNVGVLGNEIVLVFFFLYLYVNVTVQEIIFLQS